MCNSTPSVETHSKQCLLFITLSSFYDPIDHAVMFIYDPVVAKMTVAPQVHHKFLWWYIDCPIYVQIGPCGDLKDNGPTGSYIWMFSSPLAELFKKDWEVWPCWRRCVTGGDLGGPVLLSLPLPCRLDGNSQLAPHHHACLPWSSPWWSWTQPL